MAFARRGPSFRRDPCSTARDVLSQRLLCSSVGAECPPAPDRRRAPETRLGPVATHADAGVSRARVLAVAN